MCDYEEEFKNEESMCDYNDKGWFCDDCDSYNYFDEKVHENHKFTVIFEDKLAQESMVIPPSSRKFKKQLSPFRYPGGKSKIIPYLSTFLRVILSIFLPLWQGYT